MKHIDKLALAAACVPGMILNAVPLSEDTANVLSQAGETVPVDQGAESTTEGNAAAAATPGSCDCEGSDCTDVEAGGRGGYNMVDDGNDNSTGDGCDNRSDCDSVSPDGRGGYNMLGNGTANSTGNGSGDCADVEAGGRGDGNADGTDDGCDDANAGSPDRRGGYRVLCIGSPDADPIATVDFF
ncbi:hypothetical protein BO82DRAFT_351455 [Aspergillus uvarum CBS 121591]|uniref:Uncharacterized protein n=1 Tax=Aspergillus uvarum CBS 121591 TaxID=1448315 RepID=A0A319CHH3_9EURO|nr:hypothetical protein BO82DRAFT_351455 [Aspergillus uvarum CBS 121591]PYH85105.1 hypothetical protein BO82DRAFT_351455 [Aspergillus uvarum CBS 121591]